MSPFDLSSPGITFVGVGPGDPSLITLAAVQAIEASTVIAFPVSVKGGESIAFGIASSWIKKDQKLLPLVLPMTLDTNSLREAWTSAAKDLSSCVSEGEKITVLCEGDVSLFSSSSYLLLTLKKNHPNCFFQLVPGVTSISAAAAKGLWPLCLQKDELLIMPTPDEPEKLRSLCHEASSIGRVLVLLKMGHRWRWVRPLLDELELLDCALFAERVGFENEQILPAVDVPAAEKAYFSLLLLRQSWPTVIS